MITVFIGIGANDDLIPLEIIIVEGKNISLNFSFDLNATSDYL